MQTSIVSTILSKLRTDFEPSVNAVSNKFIVDADDALWITSDRLFRPIKQVYLVSANWETLLDMKLARYDRLFHAKLAFSV